MRKRDIFLILGILISAISIALVAFLINLPRFRSLLFPKAVLPTIAFLGEGGTFEAGEGEYLILKLGDPWRFETVAGPTTQTLKGEERAWLCVGECESFTLHYDAEIDFGLVSGGEEVFYIGIDDDVDERINRFYLDGEEIHTIEQGMVFSDSFTVSHDGRLTLMANDSIEAHIEVPAVPTETPTPSLSPTPTVTGTPSPEPSETPSPILSPSPTPTATPSSPISTQTPTSTGTPTPTPTGTLSPSPTPTLTPNPTSTPTVTITSQPTSTPTVSVTPPEKVELPRAGSSLHLILGVIGGLALILMGLVI